MFFKNFSKLQYAKFSTKLNTNKSRYSDTVLLPKTTLSLRLENKKLIERDKTLSNNSQFTQLYIWQRIHLNGNEFVLHDGPPYANGVPHMGHAINKILKDVILRTKILQGNKVHYIPGWDCHGLPIEMKAVGDTENLDSLTIRKKAKSFALATMEKQKQAFLSWGIIGDWNNAYATYHPNYIKNEIRQFYNFYEKGLVYRDVKPVYWSPSSRTALAEAELEYNANHKSTAVTLKVKLQCVPSTFNISGSIYALVWTTTPWTLPSNQTICYNPNLSYSIVKNLVKEDYYIIATNLVRDLSSKLNSDLRIIYSFEGNALKEVSYFHPIYQDKILHFLPSSHATETMGTGLVHSAPAHGPEDYLVALENNIPVKCMVDESGKFTPEAGADLNDLFVLSDGTQCVINLLQDHLLHIEDYIHSYPYDWRTKKPVIVRASKQWFIDTNSIKQKALDLLENIKIIPEIHKEVYKNYLKTQLQKRPYWCISRQRSWGIPIPVFYFTNTDEPVINQDTINAISRLVDENGCDFWWKLDLKEILPGDILKKQNLDWNNIKKGQDILDIWFDSGISWSSVLPGEQIADLYLEGVDQFTGWFQSSLLTSSALRGNAPYKALYVHGFAVDENRKKMSKSVGNVINPQDILEGTKKQKAYGIDSLRWWVACHANQGSIAEVSSTILQASSDEVQKIRSVLRFAVAALQDYENTDIKYIDLKLIDKYLLHLILCYQKEAEEFLNIYQYQKIKTSLIQLLTNTVSALYYTSIKDRLYCDLQDSLSRRSAQYVLNVMFQIVTRTIAPLVPHLAEELFAHLPFQDVDSLFKTIKLHACEQWYSENVSELMGIIINFRKEIHKQIGGVTLDKDVVIYLNKEIEEKVQKFISVDNLSVEMSDIFQVASVNIVRDASAKLGDCKIKISTTNQHNCPRCRKFQSTTADELCYRCNVVINNTKVRVVN